MNTGTTDVDAPETARINGTLEDRKERLRMLER
jgi:hypothetical protein